MMSKEQTIQGKQFMTQMVEYEEYTEEELRPYFDTAFKEVILPPVYQGKKFILDNLGKLYFLDLHQEEVMEKLNHNLTNLFKGFMKPSDKRCGIWAVMFAGRDSAFLGK